jgi:hypothetical protein
VGNRQHLGGVEATSPLENQCCHALTDSASVELTTLVGRKPIGQHSGSTFFVAWQLAGMWGFGNCAAARWTPVSVCDIAVYRPQCANYPHRKFTASCNGLTLPLSGAPGFSLRSYGLPTEKTTELLETYEVGIWHGVPWSAPHVAMTISSE